MTFRSILLHLDARPGSANRLTIAHALGDRFDARITVMFGMNEAVQQAFPYSAGAAVRASESYEDNGPERERLHAAHSAREQECVWCDVGAAALAQALVAESAYADLMILGPVVGALDVSGSAAGATETAILRSGAPAIVVPYPHAQATLGDRVVVAWDGSAPAVRATRAALPFLRAADQVDIATWSRESVMGPVSHLDLKEWLKRHGIEARLHQKHATPHVGKELSTLTRELGADLVVMGCYGHGRMRERLFGGVTRSVLSALPVPVLMAH